MPIPKEILAIERPKSTRVKKSGKCKKIRIDDGSWIDNTRVKYILELTSALCL